MSKFSKLDAYRFFIVDVADQVRTFGLFCIAFLCLSLNQLVLSQSTEKVAIDRDGDGLSDFQEVHKYLTDPNKKDSDNDGKPDGDWLERREYQYTIRSVVQVMKPVTIVQHARVLIVVV